MRRFAYSFIVAVGCGLTLPAMASTLGPADGYGLFVIGDYTASNTDSEGSVAVGGNATVSNYAAGMTTPNASAKFVVGGSLTANNGGVGSGQGGRIFTGGSATLSSFTANGGVFQNQGTNLPVDFGSAATTLRNTSSSLGGMAGNGTVQLQYGTLNLTGTNAGTNVFTISGSDWNGANTVNINAPTGSSVLLNIAGSAITFANGQINLNGIGRGSVLYNLYEATSLSLPGSKAAQGSVLAAFAHVTGGYGQLNGQLIAGSFNGNTQINDYPFTGNLATPIPAAALLFGTGILGLVGLKRRRGTA